MVLPSPRAALWSRAGAEPPQHVGGQPLYRTDRSGGVQQQWRAGGHEEGTTHACNVIRTQGTYV